MFTQRYVRNFAVIGAILVAFMFLFSCLVDAADPQIRQAGKRVAPLKTDTKCAYVGSPWGVPCDVRQVCGLQFVPMFFGEGRIVKFQLLTDQNKYGPTDASYDFTDRPGIKLDVQWPGIIKWAEWYAAAPGEEFQDVPLKGCYCNERESVIYVCINGEIDDIVSP